MTESTPIHAKGATIRDRTSRLRLLSAILPHCPAAAAVNVGLPRIVVEMTREEPLNLSVKSKDRHQTVYQPDIR